MNELIKDIEPLVAGEVSRVKSQYPDYASPHEAYAILKEEIEEVCTEYDTMQSRLSTFWGFCRANETQLMLPVARQIRDISKRCAAEAIQVACVAARTIEMLEREECEETCDRKCDGASETCGNAINHVNTKSCKWLHNDACVNDKSEECADFPSEEICVNCKLYEAEDM